MRKFLFVFIALSLSCSAHAVERVISAGANITEIINALGASDELVAVDVTSRSLVTNSSLPIVGYHRQLSDEGLLALDPTMLIGSEEMGPQTTLDTLSSAGVNVVVAPQGNSVSDLKQRVATIASLTQKDPTEVMSTIDSKAAKLSEGKSQLKGTPKVVFLMVMQGRGLMFGGEGTPVDTIISLSGAKNPVAEIASSYKAINNESLIGIAPDWILVSQRTLSQVGGAKGLLESYPVLKTLPAGKQSNIISIPGQALIGGLGLKSLDVSADLQQVLINSQDGK